MIICEQGQGVSHDMLDMPTLRAAAVWWFRVVRRRILRVSLLASTMLTTSCVLYLSSLQCILIMDVGDVDDR